MNLKTVIAVSACKLTRHALRAFRRGGTALPGHVAEIICPDLLRRLAKDVTCIAITGTNGKTTSARMLEQFFIDSGTPCLTNKSGSNLMRGIVAEFALCATASGKPKRKAAVIECDEAASKKVFEYLNPKALLVTNVFRDQTDRFGDVTETLENIKIGVKNSPNAIVCLNADDSLTSSIAGEVPNEVVFYGVDAGVYDNQPEEHSDAPMCLKCGAGYEYDYVTYGHLGGFRCPACGYARKTPDVAVTEILGRDGDSQTVALRARGETAEVTINLPGGYNIYNAAGAIAAATGLGFTLDDAKEAMLRFDCGFGRMERFELGGPPVRMILVKNTVGCNQALAYIHDLPGDAMIALSLNDRIADGTDISWISDVNFERLSGMGSKLRGVLVSGLRASDMAARLQQAGFPDGSVSVFTEQRDMLDAALGQEAPVFILPTYTAMLEIREIISRGFGLKNYWEY